MPVALFLSLKTVENIAKEAITVADLGEGPAPPPLFWVKKEEMTEGKMADRASKSRPGPP